jgi:carbamoyl-phosphate synthase small subunit
LQRYKKYHYLCISENHFFTSYFLSMPNKSRATLVLDDGTQFPGFQFGAPVAANGTVVFNTAMTGYPETLTDPASAGQIIVMTYPLIGNYGISGVGLESGRVQAAGLVVTDFSPEPSHWNARESLEQWMKEQGLAGLTGVDTRALAKHLRDHGVQNGRLVAEGLQPAAQREYEPVEGVYGEGARRVTLVDCGCANSLVEMLAADSTVRRVLPGHDFTADAHDLIVVAGGAGDPHSYTKTIEHLRKALAGDTPIVGVGHGHLLMALAAGAKLTRLKYGHHGHNQPVLVTGTNTALITRQNHLWAVDAATLPAPWEATHENLNDHTNEGMKHNTKPFHSTQFTPEKI